jgi:hypothetical protein
LKFPSFPSALIDWRFVSPPESTSFFGIEAAAAEDDDFLSSSEMTEDFDEEEAVEFDLRNSELNTCEVFGAADPSLDKNDDSLRSEVIV